MLGAMRCTYSNRRLRSICLAFALASWVVPCAVLADEWMTWPSSYTHSPLTGQRVDQYAQAIQPEAPFREDFVRSGYRNFRSTLQAGQSADNLHIVEQWGQPVLPYEQWRFPFRPYAVPYDAWGPQAPYGIFNGSVGYGGYGPGGLAPNGYLGNAQPGGGYLGNSYPGGGQSGYGYPSPLPNGYPRPGGPQLNGNAPGFPLTPQYHNEPWYDGTYPTAPPLDNRSDAEFFYRPRPQ